VRHWSGSFPPSSTDEKNIVNLTFHVPGLQFSTFPSFEAIATAYYDAAKARLAVTPEIARLADEITQGKPDVRAQTQALFEWVSRNIRYVAVYFGNGRYVPNDGATILSRRFGDCKDHAALLSALLAAKGIVSEQVLIGTGSNYELARTPTLQAFNHVIVYVPALDRYLDPTVPFGSFDHLPGNAMGKPVVRVSEKGAKLARTPAPAVDDNVVELDTRVTVTRDGRRAGADRDRGARRIRRPVARLRGALRGKGKGARAAGIGEVARTGGDIRHGRPALDRDARALPGDHPLGPAAADPSRLARAGGFQPARGQSRFVLRRARCQ
jgi:hypothetical protein